MHLMPHTECWCSTCNIVRIGGQSSVTLTDTSLHSTPTLPPSSTTAAGVGAPALHQRRLLPSQCRVAVQPHRHATSFIPAPSTPQLSAFQCTGKLNSSLLMASSIHRHVVRGEAVRGVRRPTHRTPPRQRLPQSLRALLPLLVQLFNHHSCAFLSW